MEGNFLLLQLSQMQQDGIPSVSSLYSKMVELNYYFPLPTSMHTCNLHSHLVLSLIPSLHGSLS